MKCFKRQNSEDSEKLNYFISFSPLKESVVPESVVPESPLLSPQFFNTNSLSPNYQSKLKLKSIKSMTEMLESERHRREESGPDLGSEIRSRSLEPPKNEKYKKHKDQLKISKLSKHNRSRYCIIY
ncbi:hypothetical protein SteCoe_11591 [Stentor coeruleus]|uniref:Uncharacterized protein n=1 Tax=Stentor coeruleus TaxID=5963 RepID=A0A1R2CCS8_9CILI|nr:hypothetical protein SteCoe_11591 [Stentor coeruleus]